MGKPKPIGKITHYYGKIGVAIVELGKGLKVGSQINIRGRTTDFTQEVKSMQIDHQTVATAKKGDVIGMQVDEKIREGDEIFETEE